MAKTQDYYKKRNLTTPSIFDQNRVPNCGHEVNALNFLYTTRTFRVFSPCGWTFGLPHPQTVLKMDGPFGPPRVNMARGWKCQDRGMVCAVGRSTATCSRYCSLQVAQKDIMAKWRLFLFWFVVADVLLIFCFSFKNQRCYSTTTRTMFISSVVWALFYEGKTLFSQGSKMSFFFLLCYAAVPQGCRVSMLST